MKTVEFEVPIRTANPLNNSHGHWLVSSAKRKAQRQAVAYLFPQIKLDPVLRVTFTRISAGVLDDDGLKAALKSVRDAVARKLKVDDAPGGLVDWAYFQEPGERGKPAVRIRVETIQHARRGSE